jgi:hypothetical protein
VARIDQERCSDGWQPRLYLNAILFKPINDLSIHAEQVLCKLERQDFDRVLKGIGVHDFEPD